MARPWHRTWDFVWVWLCGLGIVIVAVWGNGWLRAALSYSRIVWLGKISYGLYMYHEVALWARERYSGSARLVPEQGRAAGDRSPGADHRHWRRPLTTATSAGSCSSSGRWTRVPSRPV